MRYLLVALVVGILLGGCAPSKKEKQELPASRVAHLLEQFHQSSNPCPVLVAAHRAAHLVHPENSLAAIQQAIDLGVDIIEIDVKVTTDSVAYLMHDRTVNRTTTGNFHCDSISLAQLKALNLRIGDSITTRTVPTLKEALVLAAGKILVDLDLKTDNLKTIFEAIDETGTAEQVFFFDSEYPVLQAVKAHNPSAMMMPRAYDAQMVDSALVLFQPEVVHIDASFYEPQLVQHIAEHSARVWINSLGDCDDAIRRGMADEAIDSLLIYGANIIQTDLPAEWIRGLERKGLR